MTGGSGASKYQLQFDPIKGDWKCEETHQSEEELREEKAQYDEENLAKYPKTLKDQRHLQHELSLTPTIYDSGFYRCNSCLKVGSGWVYHCNSCDYDLHPTCAIWRRDDKSK